MGQQSEALKNFSSFFTGISHDTIVQESKKHWQNMEASAHGSQVFSFFDCTNSAVPLVMILFLCPCIMSVILEITFLVLSSNLFQCRFSLACSTYTKTPALLLCNSLFLCLFCHGWHIKPKYNFQVSFHRGNELSFQYVGLLCV